MARHATKKRTESARNETCCRKQIRKVKYSGGALDVDRLTRELVRA